MQHLVVKPGMYFRHRFDVFETYRLVKDNNDGTGVFVEDPGIIEVQSVNRMLRPTKPRTLEVSFNEMFRIR